MVCEYRVRSFDSRQVVVVSILEFCTCFLRRTSNLQAWQSSVLVRHIRFVGCIGGWLIDNALPKSYLSRMSKVPTQLNNSWITIAAISKGLRNSNATSYRHTVSTIYQNSFYLLVDIYSYCIPAIIISKSRLGAPTKYANVSRIRSSLPSTIAVIYIEGCISNCACNISPNARSYCDKVQVCYSMPTLLA